MTKILKITNTNRQITMKNKNFDLSELTKSRLNNDLDQEKFIESISELPRNNLTQASKKPNSGNKSTIINYKKKLKNLSDLEYYKIMIEIFLQKLYQEKK